ncbi:MAG: c-type cytochrome [Steroidobacteraceae bacterium]
MPPSTLTPRIRLVRRIALIGGGGIVAIAVAAIAGVYGVSAWEMSARHAVVGPALRVTPATPMAAEGGRLAHVNGCYGCHGDDLRGHLFVDRSYIGRLSAPNLTRIMPHYSDQQVADVIREGVRADGTGVVFMPSHALVGLADADIAAMIAHFRTLEPRADAAPDPSFGPLLRALVIAGALPIEPAVVDRSQLGPSQRPAALGPYLARTTCAMCHGTDLHGETRTKSPNLFAVVPAYSLADFKTLLSTGVAIGGRKLGLMTEMAQGGLKYLRDDEVAQLHAYLSAPEPAVHP